MSAFKQRLLPCILTATLAFLSTTCFAFDPSTRAQVYTTYAPAKVIQGYIAPLLKEHETITLFRGKLIVNASIYTHSNIRELLDRVDQPAQDLIISTRKIANSTSLSRTYPTEDNFLNRIELLEGDVGYLKGESEDYEYITVFSNGFFSKKQQLRKNGSGWYIIAQLENDIVSITLSRQDPSPKYKAKAPTNSTPQSTPHPITTKVTTYLDKWTPIKQLNNEHKEQKYRLKEAIHPQKSIKNPFTELEIRVELAP